MLKFKNHDINWLEYASFSPQKDLRHGIIKNLDLNITPYQKGNCTYKNIELVRKSLSLNKVILAKQVHHDDIICINQSNYSEIHTCDAFITNEKNIALCIKHADCQAALFFDTKNTVIAAAHCGWRGSCINIYDKVIEKMITKYHCSPANIMVGISPSLGPQSSEFINYKDELPKHLWPYQFKENYFDFWKVSFDQLISAGVLKKHIEIAKICTYQNSSEFFSYRKTKTTHRNMSYICLDDYGINQK